MKIYALRLSGAKHMKSSGLIGFVGSMTENWLKESGVIQAAGGLLWRRVKNDRQIALIFRTRYDDWSLPKGGREKGESFLDTAVREVIEETNCPVEVGDFAGCCCYTVEGVPKIVLFWHMFLIGDCDFEPDKEVKELVWMTIPEALNKLTYDGERALLARAIGNKKEDNDEYNDLSPDR
jgi:8-oxo-dGTP diphosphatase